MVDAPSDRELTLRQRAEAIIQDEELAAFLPADIQQTLHELRVHQVELTMQNEELRRVQEEIETTRARYFDLYDRAPVGYFTLSESGSVLEINLTAANMLGVSKNALIKQPLTRFIFRDDQDHFYLYRKQLLNASWILRPNMASSVLATTPQGCELRMLKADGTTFWARLDAASEPSPGDHPGAPVSRVVLSDISVIKAYQQQLEHIAYYDPLTTLPNRLLLVDRLLQDMAQTERHRQRLAVAYLDLDGFKIINDTYGHDIGDQFLIAIAANMRQSLRQGDTLSRLGGDEFIAVLVDLAVEADSVPMLVRLLAAASQPVPIDNHWLQVSASIGVTFYPQAREITADQLLRQADLAMYQAKLTGKNRYQVFR